jgi:hypothetical protein
MQLKHLGQGSKNVKYSSTLSVHSSQVPGRFFGNQWGQQQLHKKEDVYDTSGREILN